MMKNKYFIEVDMRGVSSRGICPGGIHRVKVQKVTQEISERSAKPYLAWEFRTSGGYTLYYNTSLQPQSLFNLKNVLLALGYEVPDAVLRLDLRDLKGREAYVEVMHEMYEGKKRARIVQFLMPDEVEEEELEDEEDIEEGLEEVVEEVEDEEEEVEENVEAEEEEEDEDDEDEEEEVDLDSMSLEELLDYAEENDIDLTHLSKKDRKKRSVVLKAIKEALEDEGE